MYYCLCKYIEITIVINSAIYSGIIQFVIDVTLHTLQPVHSFVRTATVSSGKAGFAMVMMTVVITVMSTVPCHQTTLMMVRSVFSFYAEISSVCYEILPRFMGDMLITKQPLGRLLFMFYMYTLFRYCIILGTTRGGSVLKIV